MGEGQGVPSLRCHWEGVAVAVSRLQLAFCLLQLLAIDCRLSTSLESRATSDEHRAVHPLSRIRFCVDSMISYSVVEFGMG